MLRNKTFAPEFCSLISNWFDMREQAPGANLLHDSVSGASSLVSTKICFAGACFRSKLPHVYWLGYLPGSVFRERVSGASSFVCTGWSTYPEACFRSKLSRVYQPLLFHVCLFANRARQINLFLNFCKAQQRYFWLKNNFS